MLPLIIRVKLEDQADKINQILEIIIITILIIIEEMVEDLREGK
jgi:hypothetical protein